MIHIAHAAMYLSAYAYICILYTFIPMRDTFLGLFWVTPLIQVHVPQKKWRPDMSYHGKSSPLISLFKLPFHIHGKIPTIFRRLFRHPAQPKMPPAGAPEHVLGDGAVHFAPQWCGKWPKWWCFLSINGGGSIALGESLELMYNWGCWG